MCVHSSLLALGVWVDEFQAMGLEECLEVVWPKAKVWLDSGELGEK
jgi:hypothetical protein